MRENFHTKQRDSSHLSETCSPGSEFSPCPTERNFINLFTPLFSSFLLCSVANNQADWKVKVSYDGFQFFYVRNHTQLTVTIKKKEKLFPLITFPRALHSGRARETRARRTHEKPRRMFTTWNFTSSSSPSPPEAKNLHNFLSAGKIFMNAEKNCGWIYDGEAVAARRRGFGEKAWKIVLRHSLVPLSMIYHRITFNLRFVAAVVQLFICCFTPFSLFRIYIVCVTLNDLIILLGFQLLQADTSELLLIIEFFSTLENSSWSRDMTGKFHVCQCAYTPSHPTFW